jgi:hypothetical protein
MEIQALKQAHRDAAAWAHRSTVGIGRIDLTFPNPPRRASFLILYYYILEGRSPYAQEEVPGRRTEGSDKPVCWSTVTELQDKAAGVTDVSHGPDVAANKTSCRPTKVNHPFLRHPSSFFFLLPGTVQLYKALPSIGGGFLSTR